MHVILSYSDVKWVDRLDTRGAYPIFQIKFDSEVKYVKYENLHKIVLRPLAGFNLSLETRKVEHYKWCLSKVCFTVSLTIQ